MSELTPPDGRTAASSGAPTPSTVDRGGTSGTSGDEGGGGAAAAAATAAVPLWHRVAPWPTDEQLDRFLADVATTRDIADRDHRRAVKTREGTQAGLETAEAYHAQVQARMARRKKELLDKELRAMSLGKH